MYVIIMSSLSHGVSSSAVYNVEMELPDILYNYSGLLLYKLAILCYKKDPDPKMDF